MSEITRTEKFLRACIDGEPCALKPLTRVEKLLAELNDKLAGGTSEVVILQETVATVDAEAGGQAFIMTPLSATPTEGATAKIIYNGVEYTSPIILGEDEGLVMYGMGNTDMMGLPGGNADAPFVVVLIPSGMDGAYGMVMPMDGATSVTLSIVQTEGAASGGAADSPVVIAKLTGSGSNITIDKTFDEIVSLVKSGKIVYLQNITADTATTMMLANYSGSATPKTLNFAAPVGGNMVATVTYTPDGATMTLEKH